MRQMKPRRTGWRTGALAGARICLRVGLLVGLLMAVASAARAQSGAFSLPLEKHAHEFAITSGAAMDLPGGTRGGEYLSIQIRMGRVLLNSVGTRPFRGSLETAMEFEPVFLIRQQGAIYGVGAAPTMLQWNFESGGKVVPYINVASGMLLTSEKFPRGASHFNFTPQGGFGAYWFRSSRRAWIFGLRYHHISNAGMTKYNPGHNALYFHSGMSWWK